MADVLLANIGELVTCRSPRGYRRGETELNELELIRDAAVAVEGGIVIEVGPTDDLMARLARNAQVIDARNRLVTPGLVDCHSHLLYSGSRHEEYSTLVSNTRTPGKNLGGGIRYTVERSRAASSEELLDQATRDLDTMLEHGTTTLEVKTGYGLSGPQEKRFLELQAALQHEVSLARTFLGAHVLPDEYAEDRESYVQLVISLLTTAKEFAEFCDVCCDPIGFTYDECLRMGRAALDLGLKLKVHADQTGWAGGTELAVELGATSVDHLDYASDAAIAALAGSQCVGVLLPAVTFHMLEMTPVPTNGRWVGPQKPFMPELARRLVREGVIVALSCDYNPGTAPTLNMQTTMQLASRLYRLSYAEIWHMCTINAAKALALEDTVGSIEVGKRADLVVWQVAEHGQVVNRFGTNLVDTVLKDGRVVVTGGDRAAAGRSLAPG